jgi:membrane dipeptidase
MVGVNFAVSFLRPDGRHDGETPVDLVVDHLAHLIDRVSEDGVGLGSDFDGAKMPANLASAAMLPNLVTAMRERQFGEALIEKVCFRNWLRVLGKTWGA